MKVLSFKIRGKRMDSEGEKVRPGETDTVGGINRENRKRKREEQGGERRLVG